MEEMRIEEKEENVNFQPEAAAAASQLQPPFASQHLGGTSIGSQSQLASLPYQQQAGNSSESRILHYLGSQDSLGQGGGSQAEIGHTSCSSRDGGSEQALARREGIRKRSKSLKCNKVNLYPLFNTLIIVTDTNISHTSKKQRNWWSLIFSPEKFAKKVRESGRHALK